MNRAKLCRRTPSFLAIGFLALGLPALAQETPAIDPDELVRVPGAPLVPRDFTPCSITLRVQAGSAPAGSTGNPVPISLTSNVHVQSMQLDVADVPDVLAADGCTALVPNFVCSIAEVSGYVSITFSSPSAATIPAFSADTPIFTLSYAVSPSAPAGVVVLDPQNLAVVDTGGGICTSSAISGSFLVSVCGDGIQQADESCDDGNTTGGDCCSASCQLETCDDQNACTADSCVPGAGCSFDSAPRDGQPCGDPTATQCDGPDVCSNGACAQGISAPGTPCGNVSDSECTGPDTCDGMGACQPNHAPAGTPCGVADDTPCTNPDTCDMGACRPNDEPDGTACADGQFCTTFDSCTGGDCQGGAPVDCGDEVSCTLDACDAAGDACTHVAQDSACDDELFCSGQESCDLQNGCQAGTPVVCPGDGVSCTVESCNENANACVSQPNHALCDDGQFCNGFEICDPVNGCEKGRPPCPPGDCDEATNTCGGVDNDDCATPQPVTVGAVTSGTTAGATTDSAAFCGTSNTAPGVWYVVTGTGTMLTASTCETVGTPPGSSAYDSKISVYCQVCAALTCVGGNDDAPGCNFHSAISWCSQSGVSYRILVHGFQAATGAFALSVSSNGQSCTSTINCLPPTPAGACCMNAEPPFEQGEVAVTCEENTAEADCAASGGTYLGDDTTCVIPVSQVDIVVTPNLPIPTHNPSGVNSTINVPNSLIVADVNVDIGINHTWVSDLIVRLTGPTGVSQVLWNQVCGSTDNINATFDDSGTETFCAPINHGPIDSVFVAPAATGDGPLEIFKGTQAQGNWTLNCSDSFAADLGTLNQWSLHIIEGAPACPAFECPPAGGAGGSGPCDDDEEDDEDGGGGHDIVDVEGASTGVSPVAPGER